MAEEKSPKKENQQPPIDPKTHRRLLRFINAARSPENIAFAPRNEIPLSEPEPVLRRPTVDEQREEREKLMEFAQARSIIAARDNISPVQGFAHVDQLRGVLAEHNLVECLGSMIDCM